MPPTRRGILAAFGSTAVASLAGCTTVLDDGERARPELDAAALREVERLGSPAYPLRTPVPIARSFVADSDTRARELLGSVPETMTAGSVPNEAVRDAYERAREDADRALERATSARSPLERVGGLRYARETAAMAYGTYEAAVGELTEDDVRSQAASLRRDLDSVRGEHRYLGRELGPALVVHADVERYVVTASRYLGNVDELGRYEGSAPHVGEMLAELEAARASLEAARHFSDRHRASLSDAQEFGAVFRQSASSLTAVVEDRRERYPDDYGPDTPLIDGFDRTLDDTPAKVLLSDTFAQMEFSVTGAREELDAGRPANALFDVHAAERNRRALEAASAAIRRGEFGKPQSATAVRETKLAALEALESARSTPIRPHVTRRALTRVSSRIDRGDSYLERSLESDTYRSARNAMGEYAYTEFTARETPDTSAWLLGAVTAVLGRGDS